MNVSPKSLPEAFAQLVGRYELVGGSQYKDVTGDTNTDNDDAFGEFVYVAYASTEDYIDPIASCTSMRVARGLMRHQAAEYIIIRTPRSAMPEEASHRVTPRSALMANPRVRKMIENHQRNAIRRQQQRTARKLRARARA